MTRTLHTLLMLAALRCSLASPASRPDPCRRLLLPLVAHAARTPRSLTGWVPVTVCVLVFVRACECLKQVFKPLRVVGAGSLWPCSAARKIVAREPHLLATPVHLSPFPPQCGIPNCVACRKNVSALVCSVPACA